MKSVDFFIYGRNEVVGVELEIKCIYKEEFDPGSG